MANTIRGCIALATLSATLLVAGVDFGRAQSAYPNKPVRIVVGFAPGGGTDQVARYFAQKLSDATGQSFVVENRAGAGGNIGANSVANAPPDGYTLLMVAFAHVINPAIYKSMPFDTVKGFAAVGSVAQSSPISISVNASSPIHSLPELIAYAKANPGKLAYGSAGRGTLMHVAMELFSRQAGIELLHVPFGGTSPSIMAVVGNQVPVLSSGYGQAQPFGAEGKLRILGVATPGPSAMAPGIPTIADAGNVPGYAAIGWLGFVAPAGTPKDVLNTLYGLLEKINDQPETRTWLAGQSMEPFRLGPDQFQNLIASDVEKWGKVVRDSGIQPE